MVLSKPSRAVGLELDNGEARAVELSGRSRPPTLTAFGRASLPEGAVSEGMVNDPEAVGTALGRLWAEGGFSCREVVLGVANQGVLVRFANFPKVPQNQLAKVIRYQAQDHLPISISSVVLDHAVIGEISGDGENLLEVLLVAARREMLAAFLSALETAKLRPHDIDVSVLALLQVLPEEDRGRRVTLVDVGSGLSKLLIVAGGVPRLARLIPVGVKEAAGLLGCQLTDLMADGQTPWPQDALLTWSETLAGEIRSSLEYYRETEGDNIEKVVLSGRGSRVEGLTSALAESLEIPVVVIEPLSRLAVSGRVRKNDFFRVAAEFAVVIALARRGLEA
ncbi:MAG TPA: type IV pilus assembly protein PilM [Desulfotomaculum sp.]|nr:type IV pilus assembly protein PilM [Desulfotomaculum sp.]